MATSFTFPHLTAALDEDSWQWLQDNASGIAQAVEKEIAGGAKPSDIKRLVNQQTGRYALALRCEQAARYLATVSK